MHPPALSFLFILLLLLSLIPADRILKLRQCTSNNIPIVTPSSNKKLFNQLQSHSFRSDFTVPLVISEPRNEGEVATLIRCAKAAGIRICARSGGHSLIGHSQCKGLLIDLNKLRAVRMQPGGIAYIEPGVINGELLWKLHASGRWAAAGICPNVGFAGYFLGGGHGSYEGTLGLACDSMISLRMVDRFGKIITASKSVRPGLFWAMCGAGGGQFGVVTAFRVRTAAAKIYDRGVVFRYQWPKERGGELLEKWQNYNEFGGKVWFRIELYLEKEGGVFGYGACYDVTSVQQCLGRLRKAPFFNTPGRKTEFISKVVNALDLHAFFGPSGDWGRKRAPNVRKAMLGARGTEYGDANGRIYQSTFLRKLARPDRKFWQQYIDFCQKPSGTSTIPWVVCEMNLFNNAIDRPVKNSFPYRSANIITHYIVGGGSDKDKKRVYYWMKNHFSKFTLGVYVNYPELELGKNYAKAYWGKSLAPLKKLKKVYDPENMFMNPQPIPI